MRRFCIVGLCVLLTIAGLHAADFAQTEKPTVDIVFITSFIEAPNEFMRNLVREWGESRGENARFTFVALSDIDHITASIMESRSGADVINLNIFVPVLYSGVLADVTDLAEEIGSKYGRFLEVARANSVIDGRWRSIPCYYFQFVQIYRKDIYDAIGEDYARTFPDDVLRICHAVQAKFPNATPVGVSLGRGADSETFIWDTIWGFGGKMVEEDGTTVVFNSPETVAAVRFILDLYNEGWPRASNNAAG